jgi:hypothetical protein
MERPIPGHFAAFMLQKQLDFPDLPLAEIEFKAISATYP